MNRKGYSSFPQMPLCPQDPMYLGSEGLRHPSVGVGEKVRVGLAVLYLSTWTHCDQLGAFVALCFLLWLQHDQLSQDSNTVTSSSILYPRTMI